MKREGGEDNGRDRVFGVAGTIEEGLWLAILTVAVAYLATRSLLTMNPLELALTVTGVAALIAPRAAGSLVRPYGDSAFRGCCGGSPPRRCCSCWCGRGWPASW